MQGDGESVPETPPNEEAESLKPPAASGATAATAESSETAFKLRFEVDGRASVLLLVGILTRLFRYVRMFFTQTDPMIF